MAFTISRIAAALGTEAFGDTELQVDRAAEPAMAGPRDLAIAMSPAYAQGLAQGRAQAAVLWPGADWQALGLKAAIAAPRARLAMARLTAMLDPGPMVAPGVHVSAIVDPAAQIGADAAIGPLCMIAANVTIGARCRIVGQVTVGAGAVIGDDAVIHAGARIGAGVRIGNRIIVQPGAVIGSDGFSFVTATPSNVETARATLGTGEHAGGDDPTWHRIHSLGGVEIGDDVEIGANSTIDSGTIRATRIGRGTKTDNLVHVGHNVIVGEDCLLCGQVGIAGSARIGNRVVLGGQTGVADNITLGDDVVTGGASAVVSNVPAGRVMMGSPATRMETHIESYKALRRLPRLLPRLLGDAVSRRNAVSKPDKND